MLHQVPGLLVASILEEDEEGAWRKAAQELLVSVDSVIQSRQLTAAYVGFFTIWRSLTLARISAKQLLGRLARPKW